MAKLLAALLACAASAAAEDEGRATLLLYKKMSPTEGFSVNKPINVTLTVYNKGPCAP